MFFNRKTAGMIVGLDFWPEKSNWLPELLDCSRRMGNVNKKIDVWAASVIWLSLALSVILIITWSRGWRLPAAVFIVLFMGVAAVFTGGALISARKDFSTGQRFYGLFVTFVGILCGIFSFASLYETLGIKDSGNGQAIYDRVSCLYFSIASWTTLGYGDVFPTLEGRLYAASESLVGYVAMALLMVSLWSLFNR
jgi:hypothetical protein